eukprot:503527-Pyramimonas_sp.AAC.1
MGAPTDQLSVLLPILTDGHFVGLLFQRFSCLGAASSEGTDDFPVSGPAAQAAMTSDGGLDARASPLPASASYSRV